MALSIHREVAERIARIGIPFNAYGVDPYGISRGHLERASTLLTWLYRHYFSVRVFGIEHVPRYGRAMLVGNHSGGVALDGAIVSGSLFLEMDPPRLAQNMVEKFINQVPFASVWANRLGQFTGLPEHAERLLEDGRLLVVFPEGARGTAKLYHERHSTVQFGTGFMRLALKTKTPIVPFAFLGGGEAIPTVTNAYALGRLLGVPYVPLTPYLLPLPLPAKLEVFYGEPLHFEGTGTEDDAVITRHVETVRTAIVKLIDCGRGARK